jgi:hypothetical protein
LESGLYAVVMAHWWIMLRRLDANAHSAASHTDAGANTWADASPHTDAESGPGMQWGPDMDRGRDLHWRPAGDRERLHL